MCVHNRASIGGREGGLVAAGREEREVVVIARIPHYRAIVCLEGRHTRSPLSPLSAESANLSVGCSDNQRQTEKRRKINQQKEQ